MGAVKGKAWWGDIGTLTYSRSYHVCVNVSNLLESQLIWRMRSFCGLCRHQHLPSNGAYSARHPLTHLRGSEQSSIMRNRVIIFVFFSCFLIFCPNKLAPFSDVSLFRFSRSISAPSHHENLVILSGWKPQEYLVLSPEDCGTK